jgi:outer membrane murein-binding lipoprotein Lpp
MGRLGRQGKKGAAIRSQGLLPLLGVALHRPLSGMALPTPFHALPVRGALAALAGAALLITGCQQRPSAELQRLQQSQEQLELKIQQLEQKLNAASPGNGADPAGKPPAGAIKSLTYRSGTADDRLRIYWADGSKTDLPCTKEQSTLVCG